MIKKNISNEDSLMFVRETGIVLAPDIRRVIIRPQIPFSESRIERIISRVLSLNESEINIELSKVFCNFSHRHHNFELFLEHQFNVVRQFMPSDQLLSRERRLFIGSLFLSEYSFESVALFNPSIVLHPDQSGMQQGSIRFIMSLRATGEGHISSLAFRSGIIDENCSISVDESSCFATTAEMNTNILYNRKIFSRKLLEMGIYNDFSNSIISSLPVEFTFEELTEKIKSYIFEQRPISQENFLISEKIQWLAQCNYEANFDNSVSLSERILFPLSPSEQNGIEDARFVLFTDEDGSKKYYATYTAYNGKAIFPQLMETENFEHFKMITLNGNAAVNKGMALFPRRINGHYAMISRQDNENLFFMYSDNIHFWHEAIPLMKPTYPWEFVNIGNCGSPIETEHGWILLTHGVGAFRQYSMGAILLNKDDPSQVIGRLREPLIQWTETDRSGYVPNVIYSCGSLIHKDTLVIPYAMSDQKCTFALISVPSLLEKLFQ